MNAELGKQALFYIILAQLDKAFSNLFGFKAISAHNSAQNFIKLNSDSAKEFTFRTSVQAFCNSPGSVGRFMKTFGYKDSKYKTMYHPDLLTFQIMFSLKKNRFRKNIQLKTTSKQLKKYLQTTQKLLDLGWTPPPPFWTMSKRKQFFFADDFPKETKDILLSEVPW